MAEGVRPKLPSNHSELVAGVDPVEFAVTFVLVKFIVWVERAGTISACVVGFTALRVAVNDPVPVLRAPSIIASNPSSLTGRKT